MPILLSGVPGIGKSTTLRNLNEEFGIASASIGDLTWNHAQARDECAAREDLRLLPPGKLQILRELAENDALAQGSPVIESHLSTQGTDGIMPAAPLKILSSGHIGTIVIIEAQPGAILARRGADAGRVRQAQGLDGIARHQAYNRGLASSLAKQFGLRVAVVDSTARSPRDVARQVYELESGPRKVARSGRGSQ